MQHNKPPFIIYALPRSRTVWLSKFLTYGGWTCHHDLVTDYHTVNDITKILNTPNTGTVETAMVEGWSVVDDIIPDARIVVVRRKLGDVVQSLAKFGIYGEEELIKRSQLMYEVQAMPGVLTIDYEALNNEMTCRTIFEHCLDMPFDRQWWLGLRNANIQLDMPQRLTKLVANRAKMDSLRAEIREMV